MKKITFLLLIIFLISCNFADRYVGVNERILDEEVEPVVSSTVNSVRFIDSNWYSATAATIANVAKPSGSNRLLIVFATARSSAVAACTVTTITWGGVTLTKLNERTYNGVNPNITNSIWYMREPGITTATSPATLTVTWAGTVTYQQIWAVFLENVNQTTSFASLQGGDSVTTNILTSSPVSASVGDMGMITASSITTVLGTYVINNSGFNSGGDSTVNAAFDAIAAFKSFSEAESFTPSFSRTNSTKHTIQGFVIKVN